VSRIDPGTVPITDLQPLRGAARRTRTVRLAALAALVALALAAAAAARGEEGRDAGILPSGSSGIVVLDLSASISSDTYARIEATLERLVHSGGRYGLVLFSDVAYEALPPGTPAAELASFRRFFRVARRERPGLLPTLPESPWGESFSGGTKISTGLALALRRIRTDRLARPAIVLVSDLDNDTGDLESMTSVALELRSARVAVRVIGLNPSPEDEELVERLLPRGRADLSRAALPEERTADTGGAVSPWVAVAALAVALILALNELAGARLAWGEPA